MAGLFQCQLETLSSIWKSVFGFIQLFMRNHIPRVSNYSYGNGGNQVVLNRLFSIGILKVLDKHLLPNAFHETITGEAILL